MTYHHNPVRSVCALAAMLIVTPAIGRAQTTTVTVCSTDVAQGGTNLATALSRGGRVIFSCGPLGTNTIRITQQHQITRSVEVDGQGGIVLDGGGTTTMFYVGQGSILLTLRNLTITRGKSQFNVVRGSNAPNGGVVTSRGPLVLRNVHTTYSSHPYDVAKLTAIERCTFEHNQGYWVIRAPYAHVVDAIFSDNDGGPLADARQQPSLPRQAAFENVSAWNNRRPTYWSAPISIRDSTFTNNGTVNQDGGALSLSGDARIETTSFQNNRARQGGAIFMRGGNLELHRATFEGNRAETFGGAIAAATVPQAISLRVFYGKFRGNMAADGGAISLHSAPVWTVNRLTGAPIVFAGNAASHAGGAVHAPAGRVELARAVFAGNQAGVKGGAIQGGRTATDFIRIGNALLVGNKAPTGGGFYGSHIDLRNATVAANEGGGLVAEELASYSKELGQIRLVNSIVANNSSGNCVSGTPTVPIIDGGHNLQQPGNECGTAIPTRDPLLDSFFVPYPGSPARFAGDNAVCMGDPLVRARDVFGEDRPAGGGPCTIGAIEHDLQRHATALLQNSRELPPSVRAFLEQLGVVRSSRGPAWRRLEGSR